MKLTVKRLHELLRYDPETGVFTWRLSMPHKNGVTPGSVAGRLKRRTRYISIGIDGRRYQAHRVVWLYIHGRWPSKWLDHINGVRSDNRLVNLREATGSQNMWNSAAHADNTSGIKGVSWSKAKSKWLAKICVHRRQIYLGYFSDKDSAARAYAAAAATHHGQFARVS